MRYLGNSVLFVIGVVVWISSDIGSTVAQAQGAPGTVMGYRYEGQPYTYAPQGAPGAVMGYRYEGQPYTYAPQIYNLTPTPSGVWNKKESYASLKLSQELIRGERASLVEFYRMYIDSVNRTQQSKQEIHAYWAQNEAQPSAIGYQERRKALIDRWNAYLHQERDLQRLGAEYRDLHAAYEHSLQLHNARIAAWNQSH